METRIASPEEVCKAVANDLRSKGLTQKAVGDIVGTSRAVISNLLSSKRRFSKHMSIQFYRAFGYNVDYLLFGKGTLYENAENGYVHDVVGVPSSDIEEQDIAIMASLIDVAENLFWTINEPDALGAWRSLLSGDFDGYRESVARLSLKYNKKRFNGILAKYICDHIKSHTYIPIIDKVTSQDGRGIND